MAVFSHLPHVLANVLASQAAARLADHGEALRQVGPSFRDMTRVAGANTDIWTDIYRANRGAIAEEIRRVQERAGAGRARCSQTATWRPGTTAPARTGAPCSSPTRRRARARAAPHRPEPPGIVAQVALELGRSGVNIVDLALAPAADMRSGAMTLWIAGDDEAARATELIDKLGFPVAEQ